MAMTSVTFIVALFSLLSSAHCLDRNQASDTSRGFVMEDKTRIGSTPPTCHNKCYQCHPCTAVQVPSIPGASVVREKKLDYLDSPPAGNRYSNYKPLGWKCRCGSHFYNP